MDTKAFVENTVSRALDKYLELHPDASASGTVLPSGGATGQYLVKKSNTDYDAEWKDLIDADGWGVAKSGIVSVSIENQTGQFTVDISDLGLVNSNDYHIALTVVGGGTGAWGASSNFIWGKTATSFSGTVTTEGSDVDRVDLSYIVVAKGFGVGGIGTDYGIAKVGSATVTFNNSQWSDNTTVSIAALHFESNDYITFVEPASGGTASEWSTKIAHVSNHTKDNFVIGAYSPENAEGTLVIKYILIAKGYSSVGGGGGSRLPEGGRSDQILAKKSDEDQDVGWVTDTGKVLIKEEYAWGSYETTNVLTVLPAEKLEGSGPNGGSLFSLPKTSAIQSFDDIANKVTVDFDIVGEVFYKRWHEIHTIPKQNRVVKGEVTIFLYFGSNYVPIAPPIYWHEMRLVPMSETGNSLVFEAYGYANNNDLSQTLHLPALSLSFVAREGKNVGTTSNSVPKLVRNLTGMVLEDLKITKTTLPTTWGVARTDSVRINMVNKSGSQYFWVGDLGFASNDDYIVLATIKNGDANNWGLPSIFITNKIVSEFLILVITDSPDVQYFDVNYAVIGKGFGNIAASNIIESPNGTKYKLKVADDGTLSTEAV